MAATPRRWHAESEQYYLHLFAPEQADLNWENPAVRAELKKSVRVLGRSRRGRLTSGRHQLVSKDQDFPDDTLGDGRRFYTDGPRIHEYLQEMSRDVFTPRNLMTVGEMSSTSLENCQQYASLDGRELSMTFNFHHLKVDYPGGEKWTKAKPDFVALKTLFRHWQQGDAQQSLGTRCSGVTMTSRASCRALVTKGNTAWRRRKCSAWCCTGCRARRISTEGEELGMTNPHFSRITDYRDVESLNMFAEQRANGRDTDELLAILASKSRDNGRTPMQWDASHNAGFTEAEPWIGVCDNYETVNVRAALDDPDSVFYTYQSLIRLRKTLPVLTWGGL